MATKKQNTKKLTNTRKLKVGTYRSFHVSKRLRAEGKPLRNSFRLFWASLQILMDNSKLFVKFILVFAVLNILLVRGLGGSLHLSAQKASLLGSSTGLASQASSGVHIFSYLLSNGGGGQSDTSGLYQAILVVVFSLAAIWLLRNVWSNKKPLLRTAFYQGMYPLVPFIAILLVMILQLLPLLLGSWLYGTVVGNGIAATWLEQLLWGFLYFLLALLTLYMLCSSVFALYISTLVDMTPLKALRTARQLVLHRRWVVLRRILFLPLVLLVLGLLIMLPVIIFITPAAEWVFLALVLLILPVVHSYLYVLYRELI